MAKWNLTIDEVVAVVRESRTLSAVLTKLTIKRGSKVTRDALTSWWIRNQCTDKFGTIESCFKKPELPRDPPKFVGDVKPPKYLAPPPPDPTYFVEGQVPRDLLLIPDCHFPVHDQKCIEAVMEFIADRKPNHIVQIGDFYDAHALMRFAPEFRRVRGYGGTLWEEALSGQPFWKHCVKHAGKVDFLPGNHEERLQRWTNEHPGFHDHPAMELSKIFGIPEGVNVHNFGAKLRIGNIVVCHGDNLRKGRGTPMYLAANILKKYPNQHTFFGHWHRLDVYHSTVYGLDQRAKSFMAVCMGWLGDVAQATYVADPDWMHAFVYLEFWTDAGKTRFTPHIIRLVDGAFSWSGKIYGRKPIKKVKKK